MATLNTNTSTEFDNAIKELWEKKVREDDARRSFWDKFEGAEGSGMPIIIRNDFTKEPGDLIRINTMSELGGAGITGNSTLEGNEEKLSIGQITISPDWVRHAVAWDKKANKEANFDAVLAANPRLSRWLSRYKDADMFDTLLDNVTNTIYAGSATSSETISTSDTFGVTELDKISLALRRQGAIPMEVRKKGKSEMPIFGVVISEMDWYNLQGDPEFVDKLAEAGVRGEDNPIFTMAVGLFHGMLIYVHYGIGGFQGTPLRPEASLYGATNDDSTTTITVGASTAKNYTQFFDDAGTLSITDSAGKREFVTYTGKTNNTFTGCSRGQTYGGVSSSAIDFSAKAGSFVTQNNHESRVIGFGAEIAARTWSQYPKMVSQKYDYDFEHGVGIEACYGQSPIKNSDGDTPNYLVCKCYGKNPSNTI